MHGVVLRISKHKFNVGEKSINRKQIKLTTGVFKVEEDNNWN